MSLLVAMVVLEKSELPTDELLASCNDRSLISDLQSRDRVVSFVIGEVQINCGLVEAPIPRGELMPLLKTSPYWHGSDDKIADHKAHLIVAASGDIEKKLLALALTRAVSKILRSTAGSIAVYWGAGSIVTAKDSFCAFADSSSSDQLPLYLWVDFRCFPKEKGWALFTHGLKSLGFMEIEVSQSPLSASETVGFVFNTAHYLLDFGPVLKDGDTIGMSADQKIKITHVDSAYQPGQMVYHLEMLS
ncbi:hypothetical protein CMV30_06995 [Nibricoccus aquaticus]|uniref:DUF4261 domain-containing protein n=1 Tax=Nibricoccus aquaticus TaxID=2576891 RepID=A0A290Q4W1_9BACT|nr:DUF4261 domain-containing protein [Nibricoccus aquaticus]ATC63719.1 hypothetical protein CMV30_06995 [Nibricoccus aquaticus]